MTGRAWAAHESLRQFWKSLQLDNNLVRISMPADLTRSMINVEFRNSTACAVTMPLAPCKYSDMLGGLRREAACSAPIA